MRRNQPTLVATYSDKEEKKEYTPHSKTNDDKGLMNQVRDTGVVTDLQDNEVQEETMEVIEELLFEADDRGQGPSGNTIENSKEEARHPCGRERATTIEVS